MKKVFSMAVNVQIIMAVGVVILIEIVGVWFQNAKMTIPVERMAAAQLGAAIFYSYFCHWFEKRTI